MKAFGYLYNNPDNLLELSECTLDCSLNELDSLIDFLSNFKKKIDKGISDGIWDNDENVIAHEHYYQTDKDKVDFVIATRIKEIK